MANIKLEYVPTEVKQEEQELFDSIEGLEGDISAFAVTEDISGINEYHQERLEALELELEENTQALEKWEKLRTKDSKLRKDISILKEITAESNRLEAVEASLKAAKSEYAAAHQESLGLRKRIQALEDPTSVMSSSSGNPPANI